MLVSEDVLVKDPVLNATYGLTSTSCGLDRPPTRRSLRTINGRCQNKSSESPAEGFLCSGVEPGGSPGQTANDTSETCCQSNKSRSFSERKCSRAELESR